MSTSERLYLYRDPAIDGGFRRRLERALGGLKVDCTDGDVVDPDPDNPGVVMALASAAGGWALPARADIVVQAGPGDFPAGTQALRLETSDVEGETARWGRFLEKLRGTLGMASLALPQEHIALKLDEATRGRGRSGAGDGAAERGQCDTRARQAARGSCRCAGRA